MISPDVPRFLLCDGAQHDAWRQIDRHRTTRWRRSASALRNGRSSGTSIVPGALPFIFTGLQISVGVAWFSLVAAEMVSGQSASAISSTPPTRRVAYPTIVIAMMTLGVVGYLTDARWFASSATGSMRRAPSPARLMAAEHEPRAVSAAPRGAIEVSKCVKSYDARRRARARCRPLHASPCRRRRDLHDRRPVGLRQDDAAERDRRLSQHQLRFHLSRRPIAVRPGPAKSADRYRSHRRLPEWRALPVEDQSRQYRLRPGRPEQLAKRMPTRRVAP